jgi:hypothetical protein
MKIQCNNKPRIVLTHWELTDKEKLGFDYLPEGEGSFFRYKGAVYDLGEFMRIDKGAAPDPQRPNWENFDGYRSDSFFSGVLVKFCDDLESVIVATYYS